MRIINYVISVKHFFRETFLKVICPCTQIVNIADVKYNTSTLMQYSILYSVNLSKWLVVSLGPTDDITLFIL